MERSSRVREGVARRNTHTHIQSACRDGGQRVENVTGTIVSALAADNNSAFANLDSLSNARAEYLEYNDSGLSLIVQLYSRIFSVNAVKTRDKYLQDFYFTLKICL